MPDAVTLSWPETDIGLITFDQPDKRVNLLSAQVRAGIEDASLKWVVAYPDRFFRFGLYREIQTEVGRLMAIGKVAEAVEQIENGHRIRARLCVHRSRVRGGSHACVNIRSRVMTAKEGRRVGQARQERRNTRG